MKQIFFLLTLLAFFGLAYTAVQYLALDKNLISPGAAPETPFEKPEKDEIVPYQITEVVRGLEVPWSIVFTDKGRILVTERPGRIRAIVDGVLQPKPLITFSEVSNIDEEGLMSLALDPDYEDNKFVYTSYAYKGKNGMVVKVVRLIDEGNSLTSPKVIIDLIPAAKYHAGSRIKFGPDDKLYITTGDATNKDIAQDLKSLWGKILRINADGSIPDDNPWKWNPVWSYGHRNPQGLAWLSNDLYSSEHGPSVFDGPAGGDEINKIEKGGNYGWPLISHLKTREGTIVPLRVFTPAEAPGSLMIYSGELFPQYRDHLFFGALKGEGIIISKIQSDRSLVVIEKIAADYGRIRDVIEAPDGTIYFSTSNRDGRGSLREGDDKIYRIERKTE